MPATECPAGEWTLIASAPDSFFARLRNPNVGSLYLAFTVDPPAGAQPDPASEHEVLDKSLPTLRTEQLGAAALNAYARPMGSEPLTLSWSVTL